jgi:hypothetical protein
VAVRSATAGTDPCPRQHVSLPDDAAGGS